MSKSEDIKEGDLVWKKDEMHLPEADRVVYKVRKTYYNINEVLTEGVAISKLDEPSYYSYFIVELSSIVKIPNWFIVLQSLEDKKEEDIDYTHSACSQSIRNVPTNLWKVAKNSSITFEEVVSALSILTKNDVKRKSSNVTEKLVILLQSEF